MPRSQRSSPPSSHVSILSPSPTFKVHIISPKASVTEHQLHISYDDCYIRLPNSAVESQLQEWRTSSRATLLDQLSALDAREYEALVATTNRIDSSTFTEDEKETLEWVQFGEYRTLIEGIEQVKARNITMIMSGLYGPTSRFEKKETKQELAEIRGTTWIRVRRNELDLVIIMAETVEQVHRQHITPSTLAAYGLPWDWDEVLSKSCMHAS
ncbi:Glucose-methanol-choline oxidoreductase N-terminal [Penicillium riverlandense]|uniref:Glucose-methanol-choline oxidoreductase N-terminal n=1 Tax=Penicillium riverlandense TaxID=1903569 RepID=UPI0025472A10|nr:Glucose-methanol-choline oxidoreductase N-terminal [Penicillium riverlandense]KAJ5818871.1 Glucose-methanol-choline oxidoreductase N-terminal [Penicillium riverlandense]